MTPSAGHAAADRRERILVVCTQFVGDTLLAIPFLRNLRRAHADAAIDVLAQGGCRAVLESCPYVDELLAWQRPARDRRRGLAGAFAGLKAQAAWLRERGYSRAYLLKPSLSAAALVRLAGIPRRIGFGGEAGPLLTTRVRRRLGRHQVEAYLDLLRAEQAAIDDARNENWVSPAAARRVAHVLEGLPAGRRRVLLAMRSTDVLRHWDAARWLELVGWLVTKRDCDVILCGGPRDATTHDALRAAAGPAVAAHVHDLSASVSLADAAALAARMELCVGVDTGIVHLSASVGVPSIVLVGPTDPNRWEPWGARSAVLRSARLRPTLRDRWLTAVGAAEGLRWPLGRAEVDDIPCGDVIAAIDRLLPPPATIRSVDLTRGGFRYEVVERPTVPEAAPPLAVSAGA